MADKDNQHPLNINLEEENQRLRTENYITHMELEESYRQIIISLCKLCKKLIKINKLLRKNPNKKAKYDHDNDKDDEGSCIL